MSAKSALTLSLVIPVYNEQDYIGFCLESVARQTELPDEVFVVENNSTDKTVAIAGRYRFVKILHEPKQHQAFAQKRGFDAAKGEIIGRIDADTILPADWVANVKAAFRNSTLVALDGEGNPYDLSAMTIGRISFTFLHWLAGVLAGAKMLWGANCAFRREAWQKISDKVLLRDDIWEDHDVSYLLSELGSSRMIRGITVGFSLRSASKNLFYQISYQFRSIRTVYVHRGFARAALTFIVWSLTLLLFPLLMLDHLLLKPLAKLAGRQFGPKAYLNSRYSSARDLASTDSNHTKTRVNK